MNGITMLIEYQCQNCKQLYLTNESCFRNAVWTSSGFRRRQHVEIAPCYDNHLQVLVDTNIGFLFPDFVSTYLIKKDNLSYSSNVMFWSDYTNHQRNNWNLKFK